MLYRADLDTNGEAQAIVRQIIKRSRENMVTLLYGAKDPQINHAAILKDYLESKSLSV